jgi:predicted TIM-barrel fold metal-dependent hydrolase
MMFFDSNCALGRPSVPLPHRFDTASELIEAEKRAGVEAALVFHASSRDYDAAFGNKKILEAVAGHEALHPCWVLLPPHTGEMPVPKALLGEMNENGVRASRVFPRKHNWPLAEWASGPLLDALEAESVPLFIDFGETEWNQVHSLCSAHPRLPVVLAGASFRFSRQVYALLASVENLSVEISSFQLQGGIEDVCKRFGAHRLLFGTDAPDFDPAPTVMAVRYAGISEEEKAMIAGRNLARLLDNAFNRGT